MFETIQMRLHFRFIIINFYLFYYYLLCSAYDNDNKHYESL